MAEEKKRRPQLQGQYNNTTDSFFSQFSSIIYCNGRLGDAE